jgi:hypothetical protein
MLEPSSKVNEVGVDTSLMVVLVPKVKPKARPMPRRTKKIDTTMAAILHVDRGHFLSYSFTGKGYT